MNFQCKAFRLICFQKKKIETEIAYWNKILPQSLEQSKS